MEYRIIGCGKLNRGDDAAGLLVSRRLRELGVDALDQTGEGLQLMESWRGRDAVIVVDAVVTGAPPGTVTVWDAVEQPQIDEVFRCSTHHFGIGEAVMLASVLNRMPRRLLVYGIEGRQFDLGSAPSCEVNSAVESLARQLASKSNSE